MDGSARSCARADDAPLVAEVLHGQAAEALLADPQFCAQWQALHALCPQATAFQAPAFVQTWYHHYRTPWSPVLVRAQDAQGGLRALWLLAYAADAPSSSQRLVHAGAHQAEYQGWLALPGQDAAFLAAAWPALKAQFSFDALRFKYLPGTAWADALQRVPALQTCLSQRTHTRPLRQLDAATLAAAFAKKSNRSRFKRLQKKGTLSFRRITHSKELSGLFDWLVDCYDFRQAATHGVSPFRDDGHKRAWHLDLFARASPTELLVTVMFLDARPVSAFWGLVSGPVVHLGMLLYDPLLSAYSPGKLHLMHLCEYLLAQGYQQLDLTPGGDAWKERFANAHEQVTEAVLYRHAWQRLWAQAQQQAQQAGLQLGKRCAAAVGLSAASLRAAWSRLQNLRRPGAAHSLPLTLLLLLLLRKLCMQWPRQLLGRVHGSCELRIYRCSRALPPYCQSPVQEQGKEQGNKQVQVHCNALAELLCFVPGEGWQGRDAFLARALQRLENGECAYTVVQDGQLAHSGWLVRQAASRLWEVRQTLVLAPGSVALYDFYTHPKFRGRGLYRATLGHMLQAAFADARVQHAYIAVRADNAASRHVIESLGFDYQGSCYWQTRWGHETTWQSPALQSPQDPVVPDHPAHVRHA